MNLTTYLTGVKVPRLRRPIDISILAGPGSSVSYWPQSTRLIRSLRKTENIQPRFRRSAQIVTTFNPLPNDVYDEYQSQVNMSLTFSAFDNREDYAKRLLEVIDAARAGLDALESQLTVSVL